MKLTSYIFTATIFIQVAAGAVANAAEHFVAGTVDGKFTVGQDGTAGYEVEIDVPPGIKKLQPKLKLSYASGGQSDLVGTGWTLEGLSRIERCAANLTFDGFSGAVRYNEYDRFCLDGQRLFNTSGQYGNDQTLYRSAIESWNLVRSHGTCGSGPCSFTVLNRKGWSLEYGVTADSRIAALGQKDVRVWAINRITDLNGNYMTVSYSLAPLEGAAGGAYYPLEIAYGANTGEKIATNRFVKFHYEMRPNVFTRFIGGYEVTTAVRLSSIRTFLESNPVSDYRLTYKNTPENHSLLASLQRCDSSETSANCLTPSVFSYQQQAPQFNAEETAVASGEFTPSKGWVSGQNPRSIADVNGDGKMDIVGFKDGVQVAIAGVDPCKDSYFSCAATWSKDFGENSGWTSAMPRFIADVNGDGRADIIGINDSGVQVGIAGSKSFDSSDWPSLAQFGTFQGWSNGENPRMLGDVNGDHILDIVGFKGGVKVAISTGKAFTYFSESCLDNFSPEYGWIGAMPRIVTDVDGDGRGDIVGFNNEGVIVAISEVSDSACAFTLWNDGKPFPYFGGEQGWGDDQLHPRMLADVNGDGLMDIVGFMNGVKVSLSTGKAFLEPVTWSSDFTSGWTKDMPRMMADINGDFRADVIGFGENGVEVGLSLGTAFSTSLWQPLAAFGQIQGWSSASSLRISGDFNGDGLADVFGFGTDKVELAFGSGQYPNLLTDVTNGIGLTNQVSYKPLSDDSVYHPQSGHHDALGHFTQTALQTGMTVPVYPTRNVLGGHQYLVAEKIQKNASELNEVAFSYRSSYSYAGAVMNLRGLGWMGFKTLSSVDHPTGVTTTETFLQDYPLNGRVAQKVTSCSSGNPIDRLCKSDGSTLDKRSMTYEAIVTANGESRETQKSYFVAKTGETHGFYTYGHFDFSIGRSFEYDSFGNAKRITDLGNLAEDGTDLDASDNVYTCQQFAPASEENWRLDYRTARKISKASACNDFAKFDAGADLSLAIGRYSEDGRMYLHTKGRWDDQNNKFQFTNITYDSFGNKHTVQDPAGYTKTYRFDATYNSYRDKLTSPPNSQGQELVQYFSYDPRFGKKAAHTDKNENAFIKCYDNFGRLITKQGPMPIEPGGVVADNNCLTPLASGSFAFKSKNVVTLESIGLKRDQKGHIFQTKRMRRNWDGDGRDYLTFYDAFGRGYKRLQQSAKGYNTICSLYAPISQGAKKTLRESLPFSYGDANANCNVNGTTEFWIEKKYDVYGRVVERSAPAGNDGIETTVTRYFHPNRAETLETLAAGDPYKIAASYRYAYVRNKKRLVSSAIPSGSSNETRFSYDPIGRLIGVTGPPTEDAPDGITFSLGYTSLGKRASILNPDSGKISYGYGDNGKLAVKTTPAGSFHYLYDSLSRLKIRTAPSGEVTHYHYDEADVANGLGRLTRVSVTPVGGKERTQYAYAYSRYGKTAKEGLTLPNGSASYKTLKVFDPAGRLLQHVYPDGSQLQLEYDLSKLKLSLDNSDYVTYSEFNAADQPTKISYRNGVVQTREYAPSKMMHRNNIAKGSEIYLDEIYEFDHLLQLKSVDSQEGHLDGYDWSFDYEHLALTSAAARLDDKIEGYHYDGAGNLKRLNDMALSYENGNHQITGGSKDGKVVLSASYDSSGNLISLKDPKSLWKFTFDENNRLVAAQNEESAAKAHYTYDYKGRRIVKRSLEGTTTVYVDPYYIVELSKDTAQYKTKVLRSPRGITAVITESASVSETLFAHQNYLGSTVATTDDTGGRAQMLSYFPYGLPATDGHGFRFTFTGKEFDRDTELYYFGARYYDPKVGRFLSADRFPKRHHAYPYIFNSYAYVVNNPTNYLDPSGHMFLQLQAASEEVDRLTTVVDAAWNRIQDAQAGFREIIEGLPEVINTIRAGGTAADNAVTIANDLLGQGLSEAELVGAGGEDAGILGLRLASAGRLLERVSGVSDQLEQQVEEMRRISETLIETLDENDEFVALQSQEVLEEMAAVRATSLTADAAEIAADATEAAAVAAEGLEDFDAMAALILLAL